MPMTSPVEEASARAILRKLMLHLNRDKDGGYFICEEAADIVAAANEITSCPTSDLVDRDAKQASAILAGLRMLQRSGLITDLASDPDIADILTNGGAHAPISDHEIDALCASM